MTDSVHQAANGRTVLRASTGEAAPRGEAVSTLPERPSDLELLERAAKAAGIAIVRCTCSDPKWPFKHDESVSGKRGHWNPLTDDGDALRLAVKLNITIALPEPEDTDVGAWTGAFYIWVPLGDDPCAATRRAVVCAAAAMNETIPEVPQKLINLARECGAITVTLVDRRELERSADGVALDPDQLAAFAERIRQDERERCARLCEEEEVDAAATSSREDAAYNLAIEHCAAAIRGVSP